MTLTWAQNSNKAANKIERSLKRHFREFQTDDEKREAERKERDDRYQQSVTDYVRQTFQANDSLHVSDAIQQGMAAAKRKRGDDDDEAVITDDEDGAQPNSLITLSGDLVVEESSSGWKVQSQSDFGTMALVLEGQPAKGAQLYYEVHLETAGMHQVGWADLVSFKPDTETGDGVGDDAASYAFDASRLLKFHAGKEERYGKTAAKAGDVLGYLYNTKTNSLSYTLNGKTMGVAFKLETQLPLVPALSCNQGEILDLRLKKDQMKYLPKSATAIYELMEDDAVVTIEHDKQISEKPVANEKPAVISDEGKPPAKKAKPAPVDEIPLDLDEFASIEQLMELGIDRLKAALLSLQCKCGGSLEERAKRLFSLKGLERKDYPSKVRARIFVV